MSVEIFMLLFLCIKSNCKNTDLQLQNNTLPICHCSVNRTHMTGWVRSQCHMILQKSLSVFHMLTNHSRSTLMSYPNQSTQVEQTYSNMLILFSMLKTVVLLHIFEESKYF